MKYRLNVTDVEWTIESVSDEAWLLTKKMDGGFHAVGTFRTPNEAAVFAGAEMTSVRRYGERYLDRLRYVLSGWTVEEQPEGSALEFAR
jgi:hypothetical protein